MANDNNMILSLEKEKELRSKIDGHLAGIQEKIDLLRKDGTEALIGIRSRMDAIKRDRSLSREERDRLLGEEKIQLDKAREVEQKNKPEVRRLVHEGEDYLKKHYNKDYLRYVRASAVAERKLAKAELTAELQDLKKTYLDEVSKLNDRQEIKDEKFVYKNRCFDAKVRYEKRVQEIKDRSHAAFNHRYHLIDLLRLSQFTFMQTRAQKWENYRYNFNTRDFLLKNGLYIAILIIFIVLSSLAPIIKNTQLLTLNNVLNIFQQASPRMFLALGVAALILLAGTDLSIGRMVGMSMLTATILMHKGINTGAVFGHIFDFSSTPVAVRVILALVLCVILCVIFTTIAGFFTARFKMHPFISTMANMLIIFGLITYATKGVSFGGIEPGITDAMIPKINGFPTIILWAIAAIIVVWFIWNKTTFGKNLYAVGGNPEAAAVSGISVFWVTMGAFIMAGVLYGFGGWLECLRMVGSGSAAYGQGWEMDAIAACVVGGVSFTGGIGKISGVVVGVIIFTALTYALTILGIDTNLQFVFSGIIIMTAVTLDCLKYVRKK